MKASKSYTFLGIAPAVFLFALADPILALEGELCLGSNGGKGVNGSWTCDPTPVFVANAWIGFSTNLSGPVCQNDDVCAVLPTRRDGSYLYFGWSISSHPISFDVNLGTLPGESARLYLWLVCVYGGELSTAEFYLEGSLAQYITAFEPRNGFANAGTNTHLILSVDGCPTGPVIAGEIVLGPPTAIDGSSWGRVKATYR
jgi:hypothetical protein